MKPPIFLRNTLYLLFFAVFFVFLPTDTAFAGRFRLPEFGNSRDFGCANATFGLTGLGPVIDSKLPGCEEKEVPPAAKVTKPSITIISPNGGEKIKTGSNYKIRWYTTNVPREKTVLFTLVAVAANTTANVNGGAVIAVFDAKNTGSDNVDIPADAGAYSLVGKWFFLTVCVIDERTNKCTVKDANNLGPIYDRSNKPFTIISDIVGGPPATELQRLVTLEVSNETPGPLTTIFFTLVSYDIDLDRSAITWFVNGKAVKSGVGEKKFSTKTGANGAPLVVRAEIVAGGKTIIKERTIIPADVDILWEAIDAYAPPFYKGKALPGSEATIRAVAIPHLANSDPTTTVYQWKLDDAFAPLSDQSGYVRSVITFVGDLLNKSQPLEVIASSFDKKVSAYGKQVVAQQEPKIIFYEKHPLYGVRYERALTDDTVVSGGEMSIVAEPFYFSTPTRDRSVSYKWEVDGDAIAGSEVAGSTITVRGTGASGSFNISVSAEKPGSIFQRAEGQITLRTEGGGNTGGSFFGPFGQ
mgnify:CR=1 FL=1